MMSAIAHPAISCDIPGSTLVFEADLDFDAVLDDLTVAHHGGRLHDLHGLDVTDCLRCRGDCLSRRIAPRSRARPDHLSDDDDAHGDSPCSARSLRPRRSDPSGGTHHAIRRAIRLPPHFLIGTVRLDVDGHRADRSRSDLVEAGAAIDRAIVAWCER